MSRPGELPNIQDLIERYMGGEPLQNFVKEFSISAARLKKILRGAGVTLRSSSEATKLRCTYHIPNLDSLIARYRSGETMKSLSAELGISFLGLAGAFKRAGVTLRSQSEAARLIPPRGPQVVIPNLPALIERYQSGESLLALSKSTGYERSVIRARFEEAGVQLRGRSEAELLKWSSMKEDRSKVLRQCSAAWDAVRGRTPAPASLGQAAQTRYERQRFIHPGEKEIADHLRTLGFTVEQQFPCGTYNIDAAIPEFSIAVEIVGGPWRPPRGSAKIVNERTEYILRQGWYTIFVFAWVKVNGKRVIDLPSIGKHVLALADSFGRKEAILGKYGVVRGDGEPVAPPRNYLNGLPVIPGFEAHR